MRRIASDSNGHPCGQGFAAFQGIRADPTAKRPALAMLDYLVPGEDTETTLSKTGGVMRSLLVTSLLVLPLTAQAEISGQTSPDFQSALQGWLENDDETSVPALAALAQDGNVAAQVLLGLIDTTFNLQGDWLPTLPREARITVMRRPGGLSGTNWLSVASQADPVATTWVKLWDGDATVSVVIDFARLGEARAARVAAMALAARQKRGFDTVADDPAFPAALMAYAIRDWQRTDPDRAAQASASLMPGDPQWAIIGQRLAFDAQVQTWLTSHPEGDALVALCETLCPQEPVAHCLAAAYDGMGGYHALMALGSPVEALISSHDFNRSPRGLDITLRRLPMRANASACLSARLAP
jgi:hypothetical protein